MLSKNSVITNLEFLNWCVRNKKIGELYFFMRLRIYATNTAGSLKDYKFSKHERYYMLDKLVKLGWVDKKIMKINNFRNILKNIGIKSKVSVKINKNIIKTLQLFKAYILAFNERYILGLKKKDSFNRSHIKGKGVCLDLKDTTNENLYLKEIESSVEDDNVPNTLQGRVFRSELARFMGVSLVTICNWRRESKAHCLNKYQLRTVPVNSSLEFNGNIITPFVSRVEKKSCYTQGYWYKSVVTRDLVITSDIELVFAKKRKKRKDSCELPTHGRADGLGFRSQHFD